MWLRLRQIALVAEKLAPVEAALLDVLSVKVAFRDPGVGHFGLENALFPIGNTLLEVVAPTRENTAGGRYLERRGGDGGYMVITQCDDHLPRRKRVADLGIRIVNQFENKHFRNIQLHPKDTGGSFFEIDEALGENAHAHDGPWEPSGPEWQMYKDTSRVAGIVAAEVQADDPRQVAARWSEISQIPLASDGLTLPLDNAKVRFVPCTDGRPEGLGGIDIQCTDKAAILAAAKKRGLKLDGDTLMLCGMRVKLIG
ncbi:MAG: hypothetical protein FJ194_10225 [Gammaproteobacteria bacterium]|nr:hypothetical protein [Gammaproteobacteria bacterium]